MNLNERLKNIILKPIFLEEKILLTIFRQIRARGVSRLFCKNNYSA